MKIASALIFVIFSISAYWYLKFQIIYIPNAKTPNGGLVRVFDEGNSERNLLLAAELKKMNIDFRYIDGEQITIPRYLDLTGKIKRIEEKAGVFSVQSSKTRK